MQPVTSIIDFTAASGTLQQVTQSAAPMFASTITPAAFLEGILIGGVIVAAVMAAVAGAIMYIFSGTKQKGDGQMAAMISSPEQLGMKLKRYSTLSNYDVH